MNSGVQVCAIRALSLGGLVADSRRNSKSQDPLRVLREHLALGVTGCLTLRDREGAELRAYVMQGDVLAASGPEDARWIVRRLVNNGALTEAQGERYTAALASGERLEDLLFGQVPDDLLLDVMAARFRQSLLDFLFVQGQPTFEPMDAIFVDNIQVGHDSAALLVELEGRRDRVRGLRARAAGVTVSQGRGRPRSLDEARLLDLCERPIRLSDLAATSPLEAGETLDLVWSMIGSGLLRSEGFYPADDDEPTEQSGPELSHAVAPREDEGPPETEMEQGQEATAAVAEDWATPFVDDLSPEITTSEPFDLLQASKAARATPARGGQPAALDPVHPHLEDEELRRVAEEAHRLAAEEALRVEMELELEQAVAGEGAQKVIPPGFDFFDGEYEDSDPLFADHDREIGRGGGEGTYTSAIKDVVDLGPPARRPRPDDDGVIEADSLEALSEEERANVRALSFGAPPLEDGEAKAALEIVNSALKEIARALDRQNGPGAGRAFVQLLLEGTPAEFSALFRSVEAKKDGRIPAEVVMKNLRDRPKSEHRQLVHRGAEDLIERALTLSCEELDDDAADKLAERVLGYQKQLAF